MKILSIEVLVDLLRKHGVENYLKDLMVELKKDFSRFHQFNKIPRPAMHVTDGVLELMPICDSEYYSFKYVNCHPKNPDIGLMTVIATGQLSRVDTGYPIMFSEMTLLTALRTSATTAVVTDILSRKDSKVLAIIGNGAQSEFLVRAISLIRDIKEVRFFDTDPLAMDKFANNLRNQTFSLLKCKDAQEAVLGADIITTCTACRAHVDVIKNEWVKEGVHINGIGGDSEGKTELEFSILPRSKIFVEYFDQSIIEGEIQRYSKVEGRERISAEIHELICGFNPGRTSEKDITLYDSVGIALEDYTVLRMTFDLLNKYNLGNDINLTPLLNNPKDLISLLHDIA